MSADDQDPEIPEDDAEVQAVIDELERDDGELVVSVDCGELGRISVAVPAHTDPSLVGRLLDLAVTTIGRLKTQMQ